jgi:hypothetical protein
LSWNFEPSTDVSMIVLTSGPATVHQMCEFADTATSHTPHQTVLVPK